MICDNFLSRIKYDSKLLKLKIKGFNIFAFITKIRSNQLLWDYIIVDASIEDIKRGSISSIR
jgi:hypothetical protein